MKVLSVFGTRPEAIKMCPLILELEANAEIESVVCLTGQHREMLKQVIDVFRIQVQYDLDIMRPKQDLFSITSDVLMNLKEVFEKESPDIVLVHGDTTTSFTAALAAFYQKIPVGHVEAGLRTRDKYSPFPEEINRSCVSRIADIHFAPTETNLENLAEEGVREDVYVTGNTVIDSFKATVRENYAFHNEYLRGLQSADKRTVLVTAHRRENWGRPLERICAAIKELTEIYEDMEFIYPVHLNPAVREIVFDLLSGIERVRLLDPIDVEDMHNLMSRSYLVLTDSGGLQEEAPAFGVPVLVLRTETERPEAVLAGTVRVVGVETEDIVVAVKDLAENEQAYDEMAKAINPYGDGKASERIVRHLLSWYSARSKEKTQ